MRCLFSVLFFAVLFGFVLSDEVKFEAIIEGGQQVPAVTTIGSGEGTFKYDIDSRKFSWDISFDFIQSGVTMAHIHGPSEIGENGGVLITLNVKEGETGRSFSGSETVTRDQGDFILNGLTYVNIHSTAHPDGEIRGQILTTAKYFHADITGSQEAPTPVLTTPFEGYADISFDYSTNEMKYSIHHDLDEATAVHIHAPARPGATSDPIFILDTDNSISGTQRLTEEHAIHLRSGLMYINIHSEAHPDGEIRGQVLVDADGSSEGDDDWWIIGLVLVGVLFAFVVLSALAMVLYQKKGDSIRRLVSSSRQNQDVRSSLQEGGISNEPLLSDVKDIN